MLSVLCKSFTFSISMHLSVQLWSDAREERGSSAVRAKSKVRNYFQCSVFFFGFRLSFFLSLSAAVTASKLRMLLRYKFIFAPRSSENPARAQLQFRR